MNLKAKVESKMQWNIFNFCKVESVSWYFRLSVSLSFKIQYLTLWQPPMQQKQNKRKHKVSFPLGTQNFFKSKKKV